MALPKTKTKKLPADQKKQFTIAKTETEAGIDWLNSLPENVFRDEILEELFRKMLKAGAIVWYQNIHGRNDKGVDFIVVIQSEFGMGSRVIGIQVKSKLMTRSEGAGSISSLRVTMECEAAMKHEFLVNNTKARLDNIEIWNSAHITEDAEQEFNAAGCTLKIQLKKNAQIFTLLEKYCPDLLRKIPQCALSGYMRAKLNPQDKSITLLGCRLNPKQHFLEPQFSATLPESFGGLKRENRTLRKPSDTVGLAGVLAHSEHTVIVAPELSGKTYLLEHAESVIANENCVPLALSVSELKSLLQQTVHSLIAHKLKFIGAKEVERFVQEIKVFLIIDNIDLVPEHIRENLFRQNPSQIRVFATAKSFAGTGAKIFYMTGVNLDKIPKFLRSLDASAVSKVFTDRAHAFITRTLSTSGLPCNPFTISMMLSECQSSPQKFSTPTMGRLIERFVEMQLGSHSDFAMLVDFETKREFLTKLGGHPKLDIGSDAFNREIAKFIESRSHPHNVADFSADLLRSGVFISVDGKIKWSHPVFHQYFWVKNLLARTRITPIVQKLKSNWNTTLAALVGSQMKDATPIIDALVAELDKVKMPARDCVLKSVTTLNTIAFPTEEEENKWLSDLEADSNAAEPTGERHPVAVLAESSFVSGDMTGAEPLDDSKKHKPEDNGTPEIEVDDETKRVVRNKLETLIGKLCESKMHIGFNLAALLVNSRDTKTAKKQVTVEKILLFNQYFGDWLEELLAVVIPQNKHGSFKIGWLKLYFEMSLADRMIGDPFLISVFKKLLNSSKTDSDRLMLLDLMLCCGEDDYELALKRLRSIKRGDLIFAFYLRVAVLYFFRFHRSEEKFKIRQLLRNIRKSEKDIDLPQVH